MLRLQRELSNQLKLRLKILRYIRIPSCAWDRQQLPLYLTSIIVTMPCISEVVRGLK